MWHVYKRGDVKLTVVGSVRPLHQTSIVVLLNMTVVWMPSRVQYQTDVRSLEYGGGIWVTVGVTGRALDHQQRASQTLTHFNCPPKSYK